MRLGALASRDTLVNICTKNAGYMRDNARTPPELRPRVLVMAITPNGILMKHGMVEPGYLGAMEVTRGTRNY
jgi:hypothetical protein